MAKIMLDRARVVAIVGQLIAGRMAEHMTVDKKREASRLASPRYHALIASDAEGRQPLGDEDMHGRSALGCFPL
jgi:hypothetical protein